MSTGTLQPRRVGMSLGRRWDRWLNGLLQRAAQPESLSRVARLPLAASLLDAKPGPSLISYRVSRRRKRCWPASGFGSSSASWLRRKRPAPWPGLGLTEEGCQLLLDAATALGLLRRRWTGRYGPTPLALAVVGLPGVREMIEHNTLLYDDLRDPVARLQGRSGPALAAFWPYAGDGEDAPEASEAEAYSALMASSQGMIATEVLSAYDFSKHRRVMDVGGGNGAFLAALADAAPGPNLALCDLPEVARLAEARFRRRPDALRFTVHAVDFLKTPCQPMPISLPWFVCFMTRMTTALSAFWPG